MDNEFAKGNLKMNAICGKFLSLFVLLVILGPNEATFSQTKSIDNLSQLSMSLVELSELVSPAVVRIVVTNFGPVGAGSGRGQFGKSQSGGSGAIVDPEGYIITNAHVVAGATRIQVVLAIPSADSSPGRSILKSEGKVVGAQLVGLDVETDLAVLRIQETGLPFLEIGDSELLRPGEIVLAFGSPLGLENSVTMGIISAVARQVRDEDPMIYIQTDAPINPGNSGGPLVNTKGELIGINSFIMSQSGGNEGLGFAAPGNIVINVYNQLKNYGSVRRGEIGVYPQTITPALASGLNLSQNWGVIVGDVRPGSPAEAAGLRMGDIILALDGKVVENGRQFNVNLYGRELGETVSLKVLSDGQERTIRVVVVVRPDDSDRLARLAASEYNHISQLGIMAVEMSKEIRRLLGPTRSRKGVVVAALSTEAALWGDHLNPGDIILSVNGESISDLGELKSAVASLKTGGAIVLRIERNGRMQYLASRLQ